MGWEAFPEGRESWLMLGGPPSLPGGDGRPSWRAGKGWEAFLEGQKGSRGSGGVDMPSQRAGRGRKALKNGQEG